MKQYVNIQKILRNSLILVGLLYFISPALYAQDVTFEAHIDKTRLSFEDVLMLSFSLSGGNLDLNVTPELPDLKEDFDILRGPNRSTSISIVNGRQSSSLNLQYVLSPKKTGTLTIGSATLKHEGNTYTTQPITVEVFQGAPPSSQTPGDGQQTDDDAPEVFLRAEIDKTTAYLGEQVTVSYFLYTRLNIARYDLSQQPAFTGFWVEDLNVPQPPTLQYETINGVRYGVALMKKVALFPTSSGDLNVDPLVMTLSIRVQSRSRDPFGQFFNDPFDDFFGRTQELIRKTQPIELHVLPLPEEHRPENFNGNVGQFTMSVNLDKAQVTQDDAITLTVKIQGVGNIKTVKEPRVMLPESFKRYEPEITEQPFTLQEPIQGEKTFKSVIIPSKSGKFRIEPVQFSYFDPQRKAYQTLRSDPLDLTILPSEQVDEPMTRRITTKEDLKLLGQDIRFIKTDVPRLVDQSQYFYQQRLFSILLILPLVAVPLAFGYRWYRNTYHRNERHVRSKRARKLSKQRFQDASVMLKQGDDKAFYAAISQALRQYLGDKLHLPPARITADDICQPLKQQGLDDDSANMLKECLEQCDFARFAPVGSSADEMTTVLNKAETIVARIEKLRIQTAASHTTGINNVLLFLGLIAFSIIISSASHAQVSIESSFQKGNTLYEAGDYAGAGERYQAIIETGIRNGYVYYNLGNALLKQERLGEAILSYERAKRLLPRDEAVIFNLDYARALTQDKLELWDRGFLARTLVSIREYFTPNQASLTFLISYLLIALLVIVFLFTSHTWRLRILRIAIVPLLILLFSGSFLLIQVLTQNTGDEAILLAAQTQARTGPGESYSRVFEIHEGAKVRIQREKQEWVEIKLSNNVIGWVQKNELERI